MNKWLLPIVFLVIGVLVGFAISSTGILGKAILPGPVCPACPERPPMLVRLYVSSEPRLSSESFPLIVVSEKPLYFFVRVTNIIKKEGAFLADLELYSVSISKESPCNVTLVAKKTVVAGDKLSDVFGYEFKDNLTVAGIYGEGEGKGYVDLSLE